MRLGGSQCNFYVIEFRIPVAVCACMHGSGDFFHCIAYWRDAGGVSADSVWKLQKSQENAKENCGVIKKLLSSHTEPVKGHENLFPFVSSLNKIPEETKKKGDMGMFTLLILIIYAIIGGVSTLAMVIGIPGVLGWKIYRKVKYHIPVMK